MVIRKLKRSEIPELSKLAAKTWLEAFGDSFTKDQSEKLVREYRSVEYFESVYDEVITLVAVINKKLVGYVQFGRVKSDFKMATHKDRELGRLYVDSAYQDKGIGSQLLEAAFDHPDMKEAKNIFLDVWEKNLKAIKLYEKYGFEIIDEIRWEQDGEYLSTDLVMRRNNQ